LIEFEEELARAGIAVHPPAWKHPSGVGNPEEKMYWVIREEILRE
jgi:hypothetical protein